MSEYEINDGEDNINGDDERIAVWDMGLSTLDDLTPLSQPLVPLELVWPFISVIVFFLNYVLLFLPQSSSSSSSLLLCVKL